MPVLYMSIFSAQDVRRVRGVLDVRRNVCVKTIPLVMLELESVLVYPDGMDSGVKKVRIWWCHSKKVPNDLTTLH